MDMMGTASIFFYITLFLAAVSVYKVYDYWNGEGKDRAFSSNRGGSGNLEDTLKSTLIDGIRSNTVEVDLELVDEEIELDGRKFKARIKTRDSEPIDPNVIVLKEKEGLEG